ncbi:MAG: gamma carbonic anhydrase family protein [Planctomycetota bacterium]|nr:gamma carbonic anhydrase family protein [Planctomycetota bacterium]
MIETLDGMTPEIHDEAFVHEMATVIADVKVGPQSSIWPSAVLRGDDGPIVIGELSSIQDGSVVHNTSGFSKTTVGNRVTVGHNVTLHGCTVEDNCLIGMGAIILDNAVIGQGSIIGAGTLIPVGKVIPPNSLVYGNPYKIVRATGKKEEEMIEGGWKAYQERCRQYKANRAVSS